MIATAPQIQQLEAILEVSKALATEIQLDRLLPVIMEKATQLLDAERSTLFLYDAVRDELWSIVAQGVGSSVIRFPAHAGLAGHVVRTGQTLNIDDAYTDPRFNPSFDLQSGYRTRSILSLPLVGNEGTLVGVIQVLNKKSGTFTAQDESLLQALAAHAAVAVERARLVEAHVEQQRMKQTLSLAHDIQMGILPARRPSFAPERRFELCAEMLPALHVGGDFYDYFLMDGDRLGIVLGDVAGKGIPAAIFMAVTRTLLRSTALGGLQPHECMQHVNEVIFPETSSFLFVTAFYGILDLRTGELEYCNAGHCPPALVHADGRAALIPSADNVPLCVQRETLFIAGRITLRPGDALVLYSDGVTEAMNRDEDLFEDERLVDTLARLPGATPGELVQNVVHAVEDFAEGVPQADDVTLLAVRYAGPLVPAP